MSDIVCMSQRKGDAFLTMNDKHVKKRPENMLQQQSHQQKESVRNVGVTPPSMPNLINMSFYYALDILTVILFSVNLM